MSQSRQIKLGAIFSYVAIIINIVAGFVYTPWMVQQIGQSEYGIYTLANSLITLFLVDFGLSAATARYISKYRAEKNQKKIDDFLGAIYKLYLLITGIILAILIIVYFLIEAIYTQLTPIEIQKFKVVYIIAASFSVLNFPFITFNGILTAYEKFVQLKLADILYRGCFVASTIIALLAGHGLYALVVIHAVVGLLIVLYKFAVIKKNTPVKVNFKYSDKEMYKEIFSFSIWVTLSSLAQRLIFNITPSILGIVANSTAIAVFGIITTVESYVYTITAAINGMFMPRISQIIAENEKELNPLLLKVGKYLYALNGLIVAEFAVIGCSFIKLWMGTEYIDAYWGILLVIVPGMFYNSLQIANTTMIATKKVNIQAYINIITGIANVILSFVLSRKYGAIGSSIAIFVAYTIRAVVLNITYHKVLPFNMPQFAKKCYLRMSFPVAATVLFGITLNQLVIDNGWMILCIKSVIITAIYFVFVYLLGLEEEEKSIVYNMVRTLLRKIKCIFEEPFG